ncbi:MAG: hypothetical protein ACYC7I_12650 [Gammaproteobacteria bacterium]
MTDLPLSCGPRTTRDAGSAPANLSADYNPWRADMEKTEREAYPPLFVFAGYVSNIGKQKGAAQVAAEEILITPTEAPMESCSGTLMNELVHCNEFHFPRRAST